MTVLPRDRSQSPRTAFGVIDRAAAYAWRILVIAVVGWGVLIVLGRLKVVAIPVVVALFLARALWPVASWLRRRGAPAAAAALVVLLGTIALVGGLLAFVGTAVAGQFQELPSTIDNGVERVETWLVEDSPFPVDRADISQFRDEASDSLRNTLRSGGGGRVLSGAMAIGGVLAGLLLALVLTFFLVKDGDRLSAWLVRRVPAPRRERARRMGEAAWATLGGYLRGAALLGATEGTIIGVALLAVGAKLAVPVALMTFVGAFVPIVGAVLAGVLAVLVALVTVGPAAALVVAIVALVVQQFDNDLLAPLIYGRAVQLHAAVILVSITAGTALFGLAGAFLAVPVVAVTVSAIGALRAPPPTDGHIAPSGDEEATPTSEPAVARSR